MHVHVDVALAMRLDVDRGKNKNSKGCAARISRHALLRKLNVQRADSRFNAAPVNLKGNVEREKESMKRWITHTRRGLRELPAGHEQC
eukprot:scaffold6196_cov113-Isochrysis_galbana.AAC.3